MFDRQGNRTSLSYCCRLRVLRVPKGRYELAKVTWELDSTVEAGEHLCSTPPIEKPVGRYDH